MPVHDWSNVDANLFHDFHQTWSINIRNALNSGLLPDGFSALVEQHAMGLIPDVLALERRSRRKRPLSGSGNVVTMTSPRARYILKTSRLAARGNRVVIRHRLGEVVCVLEIVSPGNKSSRAALKSFVDKSVDFLKRGVHLLLVDLFPPSSRDPQGIHKAIWDAFDDEEPFELPADKRLTLAAYVAGDVMAELPTTAYVEPIAVGDVLPDMPAYLDVDTYVPVPLEATYQSTWASCPADMRALVETGKIPGEDEGE